MVYSPPMRRLISIFLFLALSLVSAAAQAGSFALVYENEAAASAGRGWPAPLTATGIVAPADRALAASGTLLVGDGEGLYKAVLFRLDNDLNVAILRKGEPVSDLPLAGRHLQRWSASESFVAPAVNAVSDASAVAPAVAVASGPFRVEINGAGVDSTVLLKKKFNKTKFKFQVINASTAPVWAISVRLTSEPPLSFWKEGRRSGLNEVPTRTFAFDHQALFKPIKPGESVTVPVEAYYMKGTDYTWTAQVRSKDISGDAKFAVRIE